MKENYLICFPYQFHGRADTARWDAKLPNKKMKTMILSNRCGDTQNIWDSYRYTVYIYTAHFLGPMIRIWNPKKQNEIFGFWVEKCKKPPQKKKVVWTGFSKKMAETGEKIEKTTCFPFCGL